MTTSQKAAIIQPGAIGDCILTLPLARFLKQNLNIGSVEMIGHTNYIDYFVGRSDIDSVRSIDSIPLHRLFVDQAKFDVDDKDPLLYTFANYDWVITFLNDPENNFEQNLIYLLSCTHPAEVTALDFVPPKDYDRHITEFYIEKYLEDNFVDEIETIFDNKESLLKPSESDIQIGKKILRSDLDNSENVAVIAPGSGSDEKCWHIDNFIGLAESLSAKNYNPVFIIGPAEMERLQSTDMEKLKTTSPVLSNLSLSEVLAVISNSKMFIGNDSGLSHLSANLSIPTIAIFGTTNSKHYRPIGPNVKIIELSENEFTSFSPRITKQIIDDLAEF